MSDGIRFYDVHCHAMNLSHPNFLLFMKRLFCAGTRSIDDWKVFLHLVCLACGGKRGNNRILNLLSVMERDTGELLKLMESDLLKLREGRKLRVGGQEVDSVVLTPLMIDFGRKDFDGTTYPAIRYKRLSRKSIRDQVDDLFDGIRRYRSEAGAGRFLEVYPFLGLNTANYDLKCCGSSISLMKLLDDYFSPFGEARGEKRAQKLAGQSGSFQETDDIKHFSCAGIKVYPPLGFDPWPAAGRGWWRDRGRDARLLREREQEKVEYLYHYCVKRDIPITAHCNDGGFMSGKVPLVKYTNPARWRRVLKQFPALKLNLAHFGREDRFIAGLRHRMSGEKTWREEIVALMLDHANVYSDISFTAASKEWYGELKALLGGYKGKELEKLRSRILFGSDFMINLLATDSYEEYVGQFLSESRLGDDEKKAFCSENPERFLFG